MGIMNKLLGTAETKAATPTRVKPKHSTRPYLRIKILSLMDEARRIKADEARWINKKTGRRDHPIRLGMAHHRKTIVRSEARASLLAYAFLRGRLYSQIEPPAKMEGNKQSGTRTTPDWAKVVTLAACFGPEDDAKTVKAAIEVWRET